MTFNPFLPAQNILKQQNRWFRNFESRFFRGFGQANFDGKMSSNAMDLFKPPKNRPIDQLLKQQSQIKNRFMPNTIDISKTMSANERSNVFTENSFEPFRSVGAYLNKQLYDQSFQQPITGRPGSISVGDPTGQYCGEVCCEGGGPAPPGDSPGTTPDPNAPAPPEPGDCPDTSYCLGQGWCSAEIWGQVNSWNADIFKAASDAWNDVIKAYLSEGTSDDAHLNLMYSAFGTEGLQAVLSQCTSMPTDDTYECPVPAALVVTLKNMIWAESQGVNNVTMLDVNGVNTRVDDCPYTGDLCAKGLAQVTNNSYWHRSPRFDWSQMMDPAHNLYFASLELIVRWALTSSEPWMLDPAILPFGDPQRWQATQYATWLPGCSAAAGWTKNDETGRVEPTSFSCHSDASAIWNRIKAGWFEISAGGLPSQYAVGDILETAFGGRGTVPDWGGFNIPGCDSDTCSPGNYCYDDCFYCYGVNYGLNGCNHTGIDVYFDGAEDVPVYSPFDGWKVICAYGDGPRGHGGDCGFFCDTESPDGCGAGQIALLSPDGNTAMIFGHMRTSSVTPGDIVTPGMLLGTSGFMVTGHVHLEARVFVNNQWKIVDPRSITGYHGDTTDWQNPDRQGRFFNSNLPDSYAWVPYWMTGQAPVYDSRLPIGYRWNRNPILPSGIMARPNFFNRSSDFKPWIPWYFRRGQQ